MPIRGEASAKLTDGSKLTLVVNFATLAKTAAQTKIVAKDVLPVLGDKDDPRQMLVMMTMAEVALQRHHRGLTDDDVGDLMLTDGDEISRALMEAVNGAFGEEEAGEAETKANPPKGRGTGTSSKGRGPRRA